MKFLLQNILQFEGHVSILSGIFIHVLWIKFAHRTLFLTRTNERVDMDGLILQIYLRKIIHVVTQFWCKYIMCNHCVEHLSFKMDAIVCQHHHVVFDVLSNFQNLMGFIHLFEDVNNF